jgi:5'-nucleotidase
MIFIKEDAKEKIDELRYDRLHVVTDFDRTLTLSSSNSSWGILSKMMSEEYGKETHELYNFYRPIEIDNTLDNETKNKLMIEWWNKEISLVIKYKLSEEAVNIATRDMKVMEFREDAKEFLERMHLNNVPVIIISAGIGNFIEKFLKENNCYFDNIHIISNKIKFEQGVAVGIEENIIHSLNKNEASLSNKIKEKLLGRENILLLGDSISDIKMVSNENRNKAIKIGFLDEKIDENFEFFKNEFDIVCTENTSYNELIKILNI